jgi:hypothetical protein
MAPAALRYQMKWQTRPARDSVSSPEKGGRGRLDTLCFGWRALIVDSAWAAVLSRRARYAEAGSRLEVSRLLMKINFQVDIRRAFVSLS